MVGYFLQLPYFDRFLFISNERSDGRFEKSYWDLTFLFFYVCIFTAARASFMKYALLPLAQWCKVSPKKYDRFCEQAWSCIYYTSSCCAGIVSQSIKGTGGATGRGRMGREDNEEACIMCM